MVKIQLMVTQRLNKPRQRDNYQMRIDMQVGFCLPLLTVRHFITAYRKKPVIVNP
jgi:hypothetical protein